MKAAIYTRVSTEEQALEGLSLSVQEQRCRERATQDGASQIELYRDDGYSGTTTNRPGLTRLLGNLDEIDRIYCWDLDRLFREDIAQALFLADLADRGDIELVEIVGGGVVDFTSSTGWFVTRLRGLIAQLKPMQSAERTRASLQHRVATQGLPHGRPPIGYEPAPRSPNRGATEPPTVCPEEAALVRRIYEMYAGGDSLHEIRRVAIAEQWPTYSRRQDAAQTWSIMRLHYVLRNSFYVGRVRFNGEEYDGRHEPIVSRDLWEGVQRRLSSRSGGRKGRRVRTYAPLMRCGVCGGLVSGQVSAQGFGAYYCQRRSEMPVEMRHRPIDCSRVMVDVLVEQWTRHLLSPDVIASAVEMVAAELSAEHGGELQEIRDELAALDAQIAYYHRAASKGMLPEELAETECRPLLARRGLLRDRYGRLSQAATLAVPDWLSEVLAQGADAIMHAPRSERVEIMSELYESIDLHGGSMVFRHRVPIADQRATIPRYIRAENRPRAARHALGLEQ